LTVLADAGQKLKRQAGNSRYANAIYIRISLSSIAEGRPRTWWMLRAARSHQTASGL
jgi:hypothetical protein